MAKTAQQEVIQESGGTSNVIAIAGKGEVRYAGVDDGHSGIKVWTDDGQRIFVPSRITSAGDMIAIGGVDSTENNWYATEAGAEFVVGANVPWIDTRFADYATSDINRVLVHHALMLAGLGGENVSIMTGLPVGDYYIANQPNQDLISRKARSLLEHKVSNKSATVALANIINHQVASEAIAAFFDLVIDESGDEREDIAEMVEQGSIGIIDIGGKTTDCAVVVSGGRSIDARRSGTDNYGGLSLHKAVEPRLKEAFGAKMLSPMQVDNAVRTNVLRVFGENKDCSEVVRAEKEVLAREIREAAMRKMGDGADLEKVFFVGGGSILLKEQLEGLFPHAVVAEDPQFANARGMLKAVKYLQAGN